MEFPTSVVERAWRRSGGRCECTKSNHKHHGRCNMALVWDNRGRGNAGRWEAYSVSSFDRTSTSDCKILCWDCGRQSYFH
jgi:hypothetical protein